MLESFIKQVQRGSEQVRRRGEELTQAARLRLEVYQLSREQDALYARLGRAYYAGVDQSVLHELHAEIRQLDEDITGRETLITELSGDQEQPVNPEKYVNPEQPVEDKNWTASMPQHTPAKANDIRPNSTQPSAPSLPGAQPAPSDAPAYTVNLSPLTQPTHPRWSDNADTPTASRIWRAKESERQQGEEER